MRLPWSGILCCPAGCPVHISTAGKTGWNSQTTKSRHCQLLTKLLWGESLFQDRLFLSKCVHVAVCIYAFKTHKDKWEGWLSRKGVTQMCIFIKFSGSTMMLKKKKESFEDNTNCKLKTWNITICKWQGVTFFKFLKPTVKYSSLYARTTF